MNKFNDATFEGGRVPVDGSKFVGCKFNRTVLVYSGGEHPLFERCAFNSATWAFDGAAGNTINLLQGLYKSPFHPIVEQVMDFVVDKTRASKEGK